MNDRSASRHHDVHRDLNAQSHRYRAWQRHMRSIRMELHRMGLRMPSLLKCRTCDCELDCEASALVSMASNRLATRKRRRKGQHD